jgi:hypothetical protein
MVRERDVQLGDGRVLHAYDSGPDAMDWLLANASRAGA